MAAVFQALTPALAVKSASTNTKTRKKGRRTRHDKTQQTTTRR